MGMKSESVQEILEDIAFDFAIKKVRYRDSVPGTWVDGTIAGHEFSALVFPEHAECEGYELDDSRISKLWIRRIEDKKVTFNWDRGPDVQATDEITNGIVAFLCAGLAESVYA